MREIKFRGLRVDGKGWAYGYYYEYNNKSYIGFQDLSDNTETGYNHEVISETVGQYTGFQDSNGKDIYEDDNLCYIATNMSGMTVIFKDGCFMGEGLFNTLPLLDYIKSLDFQSIEIDGNIYEKDSSRY